MFLWPEGMSIMFDRRVFRLDGLAGIISASIRHEIILMMVGTLITFTNKIQSL